MAEEVLCAGVDAARSALDLAVSDSEERCQFSNDDEGISQAVHGIADLKPSMVILEATGHLEIPLAAALQANRHGARVYKVYDTAQTPYQRLLSAGILTDVSQQGLAATCHRPNPALLLGQTNGNQEHPWATARYPTVQPGKARPTRLR